MVIKGFMFRKSFNVRILVLLIALTAFQLSSWAQKDAKCDAWVDSVFKKLTMDERIGQLFVFNTPAQNDKRTLNTLINVVKEQKVGGLLFWDGTLEAQAELTNLAQASSKVPLMITLDGEWGLSMRLKNALRYPKKMTLSALSDENLIYEYGAELGRQCQEMRINVNFDPVLDVNTNPDNPVINTRSFSDNPNEVARRSGAFIQGLHSKGILAVGKHFPGHGDTSQDSHQELAFVTHDRSRLDSVDLLPYKELIKKNLLDGVMVGHIAVPAIDTTKTAASLSKLVADSLLQKQLGFKGLIFTDAMKMGAVASIKDASVLALLAGNDIILDPMYIERDIDLVKKAVAEGRIDTTLINLKCKKVLKYKYICGLTKYNPIAIDGLETRVNTIEAKRLQAKLGQQSITIFKNENDLLPIKNIKRKKIALVSVGSDGQNLFKETLLQYDTISTYTLNTSFTVQQVRALDSTLAQKDIVIFAIHNTQVSDSSLAAISSNKKNVIHAYFISPYQLNNYKLAKTKAQASILAFENLNTTQSACAQSIFGGIDVLGKAPIAIKDLCPKDKCMPTKKIRLGYSIPEEVGLKSNILAKIDSIANDAISKGAMPGCQVLVARRGMVIYQKSFGYHDYSNTLPVKNTDLYDLASVTKVSATLPAIMKLYDENKIELDDKITHYVYDLRKSNKKNITIYDLLTHQAGLPSFIPLYQEAIEPKSYGAKLLETKKDTTYTIQVDKSLYATKNFKYKEGIISKMPDSLHNLQIADSMFILASIKDSIWNKIKNCHVKDDKKYVYSDLSFLLLQKVAEEMSLSSLDDYMSNQFYQDLGATSMTFNPRFKMDKDNIIPTERDSFLRKQTLVGYVHDQNAAFMGGVAGHAGLFANANDLAKLYQMYLNGGTYGGKTYFSKETCDLFTKHKSENSRRGLGFDRQGSDSIPNSHLTFGHTGFTGTCVWVDPKQELIYIFLSNRVNPESWNKKLIQLNVRGKIEDVIYQAIEKK